MLRVVKRAGVLLLSTVVTQSLVGCDARLDALMTELLGTAEVGAKTTSAPSPEGRPVGGPGRTNGDELPQAGTKKQPVKRAVRGRGADKLRGEPPRLGTRSVVGEAAGPSAPEGKAVGLAEASPFDSSAECERLLRAGVRLTREEGTVRIGAWNIRWFPDGVPGRGGKRAKATDVDWLACVVSWMNVDALGLAEVKSPVYSEAALARWTARIDALTGEKHRVLLDDCPGSSGQHVGWLVNESRLRATLPITHAAINPHQDACASQLRPGLGVDLASRGGLDFHAIAVHLKSGTLPRDIELRRTSLGRLDQVRAAVESRTEDTDLVVVGDFNTMGCSTCGNAERSGAEVSLMDGILSRLQRPLRRIPNDQGCSHFYQGHPSLLDHILVSTSMREAPATRRARVDGYCRRAKCESIGDSSPEAQLHLSDHCPVLVDLVDADWD